MYNMDYDDSGPYLYVPCCDTNHWLFVFHVSDGSRDVSRMDLHYVNLVILYLRRPSCLPLKCDCCSACEHRIRMMEE